MNTDLIMIRYGELSTKGKNQKDFIKLLAVNMKAALKHFKTLSFDVKTDHIYLTLNEEDFLFVANRLAQVPGIGSFSRVKVVDNNLEEMKEVAVAMIKASGATTFKIRTKRASKLFPRHSDDVNCEIAGAVLNSLPEIKVDVHHPEILLSLTIRENKTYIYDKSIRGCGGYPVGVAGKGMMMLSGGIDSPVAAYLLMKRGIKLEMIHFASPPYTSDAVLIKLRDLCRQLNVYQEMIKIHIIPFTKLQEAIYEAAGDRYAITIMRRMMYRIADILAKRYKCLAICNGESVGQVASQTLDSMKEIENVTLFPVLRPLCTSDKTDIIDMAIKINTFDISIRPFEDCCTIFEPKKPTTKPKADCIAEIEAKFDFWKLVEECANNEIIEKVTEEEAF